MILYLLVPALILGAVEAQTANATVEETSHESTAVNGTTKLENVTSSLHGGERTQIEDELQNNQTFAAIDEDDENFQEQEVAFPGRQCAQNLLVLASHSLCGEPFHAEMRSIDNGSWCILENVIRPYHVMTVCLERVSTLAGCYYPNPDIQDFFQQIHSDYFQDCSKDEPVLVDAPHGLVIVLTLIPVSLIPVLVYLVVWKSKVQD